MENKLSMRNMKVGRLVEVVLVSVVKKKKKIK